MLSLPQASFLYTVQMDTEGSDRKLPAPKPLKITQRAPWRCFTRPPKPCVRRRALSLPGLGQSLEESAPQNSRVHLHGIEF